MSFLRVLGLRPVLGRSLLPDDEKPGASRVVLLSEGLWQRRFGSKPEVLGRELVLDGESYRVVGVLPRIGRSFYAGSNVWAPLIAEAERADRGQRSFQVAGRL